MPKRRVRNVILVECPLSLDLTCVPHPMRVTSLPVRCHGKERERQRGISVKRVDTKRLRKKNCRDFVTGFGMRRWGGGQGGGKFNQGKSPEKLEGKVMTKKGKSLKRTIVACTMKCSSHFIWFNLRNMFFADINKKGNHARDAFSFFFRKLGSGSFFSRHL